MTQSKAQFAGNVDYLSKNCNAALGHLRGSLRRLAEYNNMSDEARYSVSAQAAIGQ